MTNDIKIFTSPEFGDIRTIKMNGDPFFVAKDVCAILGIINHNEAVGRLEDDEKGIATIYPLHKSKIGGGKQKTLVISECRLQLGKLLKSIRTENEISVSCLSNLIGSDLPKSWLVNFEQGREDIPLSTLFKILAGIGYSVQLIKND